MEVAVQVNYTCFHVQIALHSETLQCATRTSGKEGTWFLVDSELLVRTEVWRSQATVRLMLCFLLK